MTNVDAAELVEQLRAGDDAAGPLLVSVYGARLVTYARALLTDASDTDSEMIYERAVEKAVAKIQLYQPDRAPFDAWLRGFIRYEILAHRRRRASLSDLAEPTPSQSSDARVLVGILGFVMAKLSAEDRLIIALRDFEELSYATIAERLDGPTDVACRQRHLRALQRLRRLASEHPELANYFTEATRQ